MEMFTFSCSVLSFLSQQYLVCLVPLKAGVGAENWGTSSMGPGDRKDHLFFHSLYFLENLPQYN